MTRRAVGNCDQAPSRQAVVDILMTVHWLGHLVGTHTYVQWLTAGDNFAVQAPLCKFAYVSQPALVEMESDMILTKMTAQTPLITPVDAVLVQCRAEGGHVCTSLTGWYCCWHDCKEEIIVFLQDLESTGDCCCVL